MWAVTLTTQALADDLDLALVKDSVIFRTVRLIVGSRAEQLGCQRVLGFVIRLAKAAHGAADELARRKRLCTWRVTSAGRPRETASLQHRIIRAKRMPDADCWERWCRRNGWPRMKAV